MDILNPTNRGAGLKYSRPFFAGGAYGGNEYDRRAALSRWWIFVGNVNTAPKIMQPGRSADYGFNITPIILTFGVIGGFLMNYSSFLEKAKMEGKFFVPGAVSGK